MAKPRYIELIEKNDPALLEKVNALSELVYREGALPVKTKLLMGVLGDAILGRPEGVRALSNAARANGASEEEIAETIHMALHLAGVPGLVAATSAYKED
ncbi:MAG TPA: carboxymuconolactone decarboxylase family protein [Anaerolineae bacterium]|jgi:alkylhydroperoxidase/carboxymuconolactone decarboxylase family protein YurZ|nr:carboxymuconolactone decarboxylase family protein [Anaerolineae bacterium]